MDIEQARFNMIEQQIRPWDVLDVDVLKVIEDTPRELFVPQVHKKLAFSDLEIPLDHGQYMMAPKLEARMLQALQIQADDEILEIGSGTGFVTACLAKLGKQVKTVEYYEDLSNRAQETLQQQNITNVNSKIGDILEDKLKVVPAECIRFHASRNHFSNCHCPGCSAVGGIYLGLVGRE